MKFLLIVLTAGVLAACSAPTPVPEPVQTTSLRNWTMPLKPPGTPPVGVQ